MTDNSFSASVISSFSLNAPKPPKNTGKDTGPAKRFGRKSMAILAFAAFLLGYFALSTPYSTQCQAQVPGTLIPAPPVVVAPALCAGYPLGCGELCVLPGTSATIENTLYNTFHQILQLLTNRMPSWTAEQVTGNTQTIPGDIPTPAIEGAGDDGFIGGSVDIMVQAILDRLNTIELDMMDWWDTMWEYNLRPVMQNMTIQIGTATGQQTDNYQGGMDAYQGNEVNLQHMDQSGKDHGVSRVSENACVAATMSGGTGRATNVSRSMRIAWQNDAHQNGMNEGGSGSSRAAATSAAAKRYQDAQTFENLWCDPNDQAGHNNCGSGANKAYANADVQVTKNFFNKLTIQVDSSNTTVANAGGAPVPGSAPQGYEALTVQANIDNMMDDPTGDPQDVSYQKTVEGQERWLMRRSYLARYAANRAVPDLVAGWRMPGGGTQFATFLSQLRQDAGTPTTEISTNPSYKEIMHALTVDRFNSGKYADYLTGDDSEIEMEKLTLSTLYLMQLRDYYELLERESLTLAVQVAMMADHIPIADSKKAQSVR
jgi:hypothetical protein